jgi:hypothetical protein
MRKNIGSILMNRYGPFIAVLAFAAFLRFYFIHYPMDLSIFPETLGYNGIDEGVHLMAGRLASNGWTMYEDVNPQQGPFVMMIYTFISGDLIQARVITALFSLIGIGAVMTIGKDIGGKWTGVISGILVLANYEFLKESRHASADLFASVSLILAFLFLVKYLKNKNENEMKFSYRTSLLVLTGIMLSISTMSKLFSIVAVFGVGLFLLIPLIRSRESSAFKRREGSIDLAILVISTMATTVILMSIFGMGNTFQGIVLDNMHRPTQPIGDKVLFFGDFALFTAFPLVIGTWWAVRKRDDPMVRLMSLWAFPMMLMFIFQSLTWVHYYILIVPPLCILSAMPMGKVIGRSEKNDEGQWIRRAFKKEVWNKDRKSRSLALLFTLYVVLSLVFSTAAVFGSHRPIEDVIADDIKTLTEEGDMIICGDPVIALMADRDQPPEATNLAEVRHPELTSEDLVEIIYHHDVRLVVISYHLSTYDDFYQWISANWTYQRAYGRPDRIYDEWKEPGEGIYLMFTT